MSKIKDLSKITTRFSKKEGIAHPTIQKYDFNKPTVINMSKEKIRTLVRTGRFETDGLTIIYEE
tara:strand:+ start:265 stop:456 length:192 start_codon:yes stop_codon:yes gene_type:complete